MKVIHQAILGLASSGVGFLGSGAGGAETAKSTSVEAGCHATVTGQPSSPRADAQAPELHGRVLSFLARGA